MLQNSKLAFSLRWRIEKKFTMKNLAPPAREASCIQILNSYSPLSQVQFSEAKSKINLLTGQFFDFCVYTVLNSYFFVFRQIKL